MATPTTADKDGNQDSEGDSLPGWAEFARDRLPPRTETDARLVLFHSRWRLARSFERLDAPGFSDPVRDGYSAAFKVFLAYTAHEQLAEAVGLHHADFPIYADSEFAGRLRSDLDEIRPMVTRNARGIQRKGLASFWAGQHDDVRFVAYGLRNTVAHGLFTASRLRTKASQSLLKQLADRVLVADAVWFNDWLSLVDDV